MKKLLLFILICMCVGCVASKNSNYYCPTWSSYYSRSVSTKCETYKKPKGYDKHYAKINKTIKAPSPTYK